MLIPHQKHTADDLSAWSEYEAADMIHGVRTELAAKVNRSQTAVCEFVANHPRCYASVSWGKDSTVLAELVQEFGLPLVWIRVEPICNPDCVLVRDAFLEKHPETRYEEIAVQCRRGDDTWHAAGTLEAGFAKAVALFGRHYLSGIRAEESGVRTIRFWKHGLTTKHACAPLGWWTVADIFGYLAVNQLPVHPVYGMFGGGRWQREHLRVSSLGGQRGAGMGRAEWEDEYYGDVLAKLRHQR